MSYVLSIPITVQDILNRISLQSGANNKIFYRLKRVKSDLLFYRGDLKIVKACAECQGTDNRKVLCLRNIYVILGDKGTEITINNY